MKKRTKRRLSFVLTIVMLLGLLPDMGSLIPTAQAAEEEGTNKDAFGIEMADWTESQREAAEANAPLGGGLDSSTAVMTFSELYISTGYDRKTRVTETFDWTGENVVSQVANMGESSLKQVTTEGYKFVETAAMDMNGSGKDEYVANLAYTSSGSKLQLFVTDSEGRYVTNTVLVASSGNIDQIDKLSTYQIRGSIAVVAGDFDGDGKDSILVYIPAIEGNSKPCIWQYGVSNGKLVRKNSSVSEDLFTTLGIQKTKNFDPNSPDNQPMVSMVAEDVDRDGYDELILTAGTNDMTQSNNDVAKSGGKLGSQLFVYDEINARFQQTYKQDLHTTANGTADQTGRIVWASSTVGNVVLDSGVDYPEIISAGYVDNGEGYDITVPLEDTFGAVVVGIDPSSPVSGGNNVQAKYYVKSRNTLAANNFTKDGFYESDGCNNLMAVQAFADRGAGQAESVFISGSVYRYGNSDGTEGLKETYVPGHFQDSVDSLDGTDVTNAIIQTVTAGNFDGNREGREQIICAVSLRQSGHNNSWSDVIIVHNNVNNGKDNFGYSESTPNGPGFSKRDCFYITLNALDVDDDSLVLTLMEMKREYSAPDVLAILESAPYFAEIDGGDTGNSATTYGTAKSSGSGSSESTGFSAGVTVGYEVDGLFFGGGAETTIETSFTSSTASSQSTEWAIEYANDAGDNLVVVYRCPVACYRYVDQTGEEVVIFRSEQPATSMIPVEEYNALAPQFGLEPISDDLLGEPGNPFSYRSSTASLPGSIEGTTTDAQVSPDGWVQYYGQGTVTQSLTTSAESEETFEYGLDVSVSVWGKAGGAKAGVNAGYSESHSETTVNGSSVTKAGSVTSKSVEGYDFQWKFIAFQHKINDNTVPVLGYMVTNVVAPPSPPVDLTVDDVTSNSLTLSWDHGSRTAQQYRIYRVLEESSMPYVQVASVAGNVNEYTITGLNPGTTYTYVVRAVGYDELGAEQISVDSSPVTARTTTDGSTGVSVTLTPSDGLVNSNGQSASVTANVYNPGSGGTYYKWQIRTPGGDRWVDLANGEGNDGIGSVSGAAAKTLTMTSIDGSLNGASLRCIVTAPTSDATPEYYYSPIATLSLQGDRTSTNLSVTGSQSGEGTAGSPHTGLADYKEVTREASTGTKIVPVTVESGGKEYTVYSYDSDLQSADNELAYVGAYTDTSGTSYVKVTKQADGSFTVGDPLTAGTSGYYYNDSNTKKDYNAPAGFNGSTLETETVTTGEGDTAVTTTYYRSYLFANGKPTTEYWYNQTDGKYYTRTGGEGSYTYTEVSVGSDDDIRRVYLTTAPNTFVVDQKADTNIYEGDATTPGYGYYKFETYTGSTGSFTLSATFWYETDTGLYYETTAGDPPATSKVKYADSASLDAVTEETTETIYTDKTTPRSGTTITLSSNVTKDGSANVATTVDYVITHLPTGSKTALSAASGASVTWTASSPGLYEITATARSTVSTLSSTATCYYYAREVAPESSSVTEYQLLVQDGGSVVSNATYQSGQAFNLVLQSRAAAGASGTPGAWTPVSDNVTYTVTIGADIEHPQEISASYPPAAAGSYSFAAKIGGKVVATAMLNITKQNVTLEPVWDGTLPQELSDITVSSNPSIPDAELKDAIRVSCDLYDSNGNIQSGKYGSYPVTLSWTAAADDPDALSQAAKTIQSRYNITQRGATIYRPADAVEVFFSSGENGTINAVWFGDGSGGEQSFNSGASVSTSSDVKFTAMPGNGFVVEKWTVNGQEQADGVEKFPNGGQTLTLDLNGRTEIINVVVTFTNSHNTVSFSSSSANGTVAAKDSSDHTIQSGDSVAHGASVTLTATPAEGYMVSSWTVNNQTYTWPTGESYREDVLTLENIDQSYTVVVNFTEKSTTQVIISDAVDSENAVTSAASVEVKYLDGTSPTLSDGSYTVQGDDSLVLTAKIQGGSDNTRVTEWQSSTDGQTWTAIPGSGSQDSITIHNFSGEKLYVRVKVSTAQSYRLSWEIQMDGTTPSEDIAKLTASSNGVALTSGEAQTAYTTVDFTLELNDAYYVVEWSKNVTANDTTATLDSLTANTTVTVTIAKKPVLTIDSVTGGSVEVKGTVNGVPDTTVQSGGYVDYGTAITVTLKPDVGYEVGALQGSITAAYTDGNGKTTDNKRYTVQSVTSDWTVEQAWTELDEYQVQFSVVDTGSGTNGDLLAAVDRKGLESYQNTDFTSGDFVYHDSTVTFTAEPAPGYRVQEWTVDGVVQKNGDFNNISTSLTLTPGKDTVVTVQYMEVGNKITAVAGSGGTITGAMAGSSDVLDNIASGFILAEDASVTFTVTPDPGYEVQAWLVNGVPVSGESGDTFTYVSEQDGAGAAITVVFQQIAYTVSWGSSNGTVTAEGYSESSAQIRGGTQLTLTATPNAGYTPTGWTVNGQEITDGVSGNTLTWIVPNGQAADPAVSSFDIQANFGRGGYPVTITQPANGTITANVSDLTNVTGGTTVTFTAEPEEGYILVGWIVDGVTTDSRSNTYQVQIDKATTVSADIVPSHYNVNYGVSDPDHGSITAQGTEENPVSVAYGESITFTAAPAQYYHVSGWQVDGVLQPGTANQSSFTLDNVTKDQIVTAVIAPAVSYEVGYEAGTNGSITAVAGGEELTLTPEQTKNVLGGSELQFTAKPDSGYMLDHWEISTDGGKSFVTVSKDNLETLGLTMTHPLSTVLTVKSLSNSFYAKAVYTTYAGYAIPTGNTGYTIESITRLPDDTAPGTDIRKGGDLTFIVKPEATYAITAVTVADENAEIKANADGGWTVTILNVQADIALNVNTVAGIPLTIDCGANGSLSVKRNDVELAANTGLQAGDQLVISAVPDRDYRLKSLTVNGQNLSSGSTYTVQGDETIVAVKAEFEKQPTGGGGGGGAVAATHDILIVDPSHGQLAVSKKTAAAGDEITITVQPEDGYSIGTVTVTDANGKAISLDNQGDGTYTFVMPDSSVTITAAFHCNGGAGCPTKDFLDVGTGWYHDAVDYVVEHGLMNGTDQTTFSPNLNLTRGMIVTILWRLEGQPQAEGDMPFNDVAEDQWYADAIRWAADNDIVRGISDTVYAPNADLTREQMATILYRYAVYKGLDVTGSTDLSGYADADEIRAYAKTAMTWANAEGLITGVTQTELAPAGTATRAQMATILMRFCENIVKE